MLKYAAWYMQQYAAICILINMQIYPKHLQEYALYAEIYNPKFMQK